MADVIAIGELLIDFTPYGLSEQGQPLFERNPGGAPANVAAALAKLGSSSAFIGKVGDDAFGQGLKAFLQEHSVDVSGLQLTDEAHTTLAFVHLNEQGDRSFSFYRQPGADQLLRAADIPYSLIDRSTIMHFGSVSMTGEPSRSATLAAVRYAKDKGLLISYDPNLRPALWSNRDEAKTWILEGMQLADVVKVSEEELLFLTGSSDLEAGSRMLVEQYSLSLLFVTLGEHGSYCRAGMLIGSEAGYQVNVVDTTGAGDGFFAGALYCLLRNKEQWHTWNSEQLASMLRFANATGALATTRKGGIPAMPSPQEVEQLMERG